jgi:adenylate cyclase
MRLDHVGHRREIFVHRRHQFGRRDFLRDRGEVDDVREIDGDVATTVVASQATVALTGRTFVWRELDAIRVKGRTQAVRIFEPLGVADEVAPELLSRAQAYGKGLSHYRAHNFVAAAEQFALVAGDDPPAALFLQRVRQLVQHPPGPDWEPVTAQEEK